MEAPFTFANSLIAGDCAGPGSLTSLGGNVESPGATCGLTDPSDQPGVSAAALGLAPLGPYGGPTPTHALLPGSAAVYAGLAAHCTAIDQRGQPRVAATCDAGAFELQPGESPLALFADGFESGDTSACSGVAPLA